MSKNTKSIFSGPPSARSDASPSSVRPPSSLKRRYSESAQDLRLEADPASNTNAPAPALASLRARAIYGQPGPRLAQEHALSLPRQSTTPEFKTPAPPSPRPPGGRAGSSSQQRTSPTLKRPASEALRIDLGGPSKRLRRDRVRRAITDHPASSRHPPPQSPLFFSYSSNPRPQLPPRFSSSEAAARMLSKAQGEDANIKTVKLARGKIGSPAVQRPSPRSHFSSDRWSTPRSSDSPDAGDTAEQLNHVGILEFLEQDERPTLVVDMGDPANFTNAGLQVIFANSALRSVEGLHAAVSGPASDAQASPKADSTNAFLSFKTWLLSPSASVETHQRVPSRCIYSGVSWSASVLRRRLRIVSGTLLSDPEHDTSVASPVGVWSPSASSILRGGHAISNPSAGTPKSIEADDYFGASALPRTLVRPAQASTAETSSIIVPSIEAALSDTTSMHNNVSATPDAAVESESRAAGSDREVGFFDWTRLPVSNALPRHVQFARSVDWAATSLGPIETWSADLRQMCNLIMASPHPAAMYWGEDLVAIYNEAYVLLAGQKHPALMGQSYREAWSEIWDEVKDVFASAQQTGQATMKDDDCLFIKRNDFLEETYFSWSIIPMVGADGSVHGLYNPAFEKTRRKIAERRMLTLREVGERTAVARDVKGFWDEVLSALECNEYDTPFVLLYSLCDELDSEESSIYSNSVTFPRQCYLEGGLGVPKGHPSAPETVDFASSNEGFIPLFREVAKANKHKLFETHEIQSHLLDGLEWRGFGDPAKSVVICPIHPTTGESTLGFLVMGINPRRPYDEDYNLFVQLLSRQLATSLASVVLFEEEIRRGQRAAKLAALDRIQLSEQLAARTAEAIESETKFTRMAEFAPVGMFIADSSGKITYCNDTWYDITRVPRGDADVERWTDYVSNEDKALVASLWHDLVEKKRSVSGEFKFKAPWIDRNGLLGETWVLFSAYPEKDSHGLLKSVFGCMTNISQQKWAEGFQKRKMEEAVELKRQQENFIDITSHEMRNPLSAILQCADEIIQSLGGARAKEVRQNTIDDTIDAAQTIALCAQHQKRIVDDVLTMSKLDSALLMVTPVDVQPLTVAQRALKMFENETHTAEIDLSFVVDQSFKDLCVDWVRFDPSRVLQVLINLTTNAIKFTTTETQKSIVVSLAASLHKPSEDGTTRVSYVPARTKQTPEDVVSANEWGTGEVLYIQFAVEDTGRGLTDEEKKLLFMRFSQASPRTHVQYGGSGLGLFISRELTELQGGEIGVASEAGKGSTFAFYIMARRSTAPTGVSEVDIAALGRKPSATRSAERSKTRTREMVQARSAARANDDDDGSGSSSSSSGAARASIKEPLKVLIVEDNLVNQKVLQKQLRNLGCETHVANHGGEALEVLEKSWFWAEGTADEAIALHVVLMDQEMPVMDGLTCTRRIRELERQGRFRSHVPIIAVTANARNEQIQTAMEAGMDDVVSKPFRIPELIPKIEELISKHSSEHLGGPT